MREQKNQQGREPSCRPLQISGCGCKGGNLINNGTLRQDLLEKRLELVEQLEKQFSESKSNVNIVEIEQRIRSKLEGIYKLEARKLRKLTQERSAEQNEMTLSESQEDGSQEHEIGIMQAQACCPNGCIITNAANGCSVAEGSGTVANGQSSHAEGQNSQANGIASHAEGISTLASVNGIAAHAEGSSTQANALASHAEGHMGRANGLGSHAEGEETRAEGRGSHAEGGPVRDTQGIVVRRTIAQGNFSHAEGLATFAALTASHSEGSNTIASGEGAHAEGVTTFAVSIASHAEGSNTTASGEAAHAEGVNTFADSFAAHAEGSSTTASGGISHAEGEGTIASGSHSHAEGLFSRASADIAHAEGSDTIANGFISHAEGEETRTEGRASHSEGRLTFANGDFSHAEGDGTTASGSTSHAEGRGTIASGFVSHAEGSFTTASGIASHAEGSNTRASGERSHAEGRNTIASGGFSHAEGDGTVASGPASHAQGSNTRASGQHSHAEGLNTLASGFISHAQGRDTIANAALSHAEGNNTSASGLTGVHIMGRFGDANELDYSWYLANGTGPANRGLAAKILRDGNVKIDGTVSSPAADYAEMFETIDGKPIEVGYFVTAAGKGKIQKATANDHFILGITSATPSVLGNSAELKWKNKYITDEWGRVQYHEITIPADKDKEGQIIIPERTEIQPMLHPEWDSKEKYIPRLERPEWVAVGLIGQVLVRDDGTCEELGYCWPNNDGIATKSKRGYFVLKRKGPNQILVLVTPLSKPDIDNRIERLGQLIKYKEQGYLSEEEFQNEKEKLLNL
ncbi:hypothetical protein BTR23_16045 [Alkalihalophilus pseudofirmus]|nr:hypothetical protein BTR23_16045 [Alkalihalophilus pseudofirmus]